MATVAAVPLVLGRRLAACVQGIAGVRSCNIPRVTEARLSREQCQEIAERTMRSLDSLEASDALERFRIGECHVNKLTSDELTGKPFRRIIYASSFGEDHVLLTVAVRPEPGIVRHARRFKLIAGFIEGWRGAGEAGQSTRLLKRERG
jgi:hypothetical protein